MGIGYPDLEVAVQVTQEKPYQNIPQKMVSEGLIGSAAYSLWLDDLTSLTGNILFGGVDSDKYVGDLKTLDIVKEGGIDLEMIVSLSGVSVVDGSSNTTVLSAPIDVLLDSGSTLSYLPTKTANAIYSAVGATFDAKESIAVCSCSLATSSKSVDFLFGGKVINVKLSEIVLQGGTGSQDSDSGCVFGIVAQDSESAQGSGNTTASYTLGDSFIRNAYVVYDLQNNQISLAQTNFESTSTNIHEITNSSTGTSSNGVAADKAKDNGASTIAPWAGFLGAGLLLAATL